MSMAKIDFAAFNEPKYFPMWLCDGDTLRLAEYDDAQLEELDRNILNMSAQFDIDNAAGAELDRIGKILGEDRGGNSDKVYRIYLKLKTMLNTANGTVEDIIKFVKFFYSSETVHLVPDYPAGLRILHDGFNDTLDFNRIIRQIVGAGISYDTREIFKMADEFPFTEKNEKHIHRVEKESFARNVVFRNGRVLRDGTTVLPAQYERLFRDGTAVRDGSVPERAARFRTEAEGDVNVPVLRNSGLPDLLMFTCRRLFEDRWRSALFRNGAVLRDGSESRGGEAESFINDALDFDGADYVLSDSFPMSGTYAESVVFDMADEIGRNYSRDGSLARNGGAYRSSRGISDPFTMRGGSAAVSEKWNAAVKRNGSVYRNGAETRGGFSASVTFLDTVTVGVRHHYSRDGLRFRNGSIERNGGVLIAV